MSKGRYKEFDPVIYPRKFFVARGTKEFINEHFSNIDGSDIVVDYSDCDAWAHLVKCRDNDRFGVLVWYEPDVSPGSLCHEVMHAVNAYVHSLGTRIPSYEDDSYEEFTCYLGGWMFDCIWNFKNGKV